VNPGIVKTVEWLRSHQFSTCDSGDGKTHDFECDQPYPYVYMEVAAEDLAYEADRLVRLLRRDFPGRPEGFTQDGEYAGWVVEANYSPQDGYAFVTLVNFTVEGAK